MFVFHRGPDLLRCGRQEQVKCFHPAAAAGTRSQPRASALPGRLPAPPDRLAASPLIQLGGSSAQLPGVAPPARRHPPPQPGTAPCAWLSHFNVLVCTAGCVALVCVCVCVRVWTRLCCQVAAAGCVALFSPCAAPELKTSAFSERTAPLSPQGSPAHPPFPF